eukprot:TRINITY_DN5263_c0_g1_i1.p1 TRINITY_DN5263_c0_g1~~TRINITY_DN5263_c0_g1_i1.p1  ORF type:complete len:857 (+),score=168.37 TRINITY_DN5263_c0_g1_i1:94-2571(+)
MTTRVVGRQLLLWWLLLLLLMVSARLHLSFGRVLDVDYYDDDDAKGEEERCHVEPGAYYGDEQVEKLLLKGKALEAKGRTARAMECYALAASTSTILSPERSLSSLLLLAKLEASITTTFTSTSNSRTWEVLRDLVYNGRIPPEVLGIPRQRSRIGNSKKAKREDSRKECLPLVQPMMQQQRFASSYKLVGSIYEELKCHWEASNFYYMAAMAMSSTTDGRFYLLTAEQLIEADEPEHAMVSLRSMVKNLPKYSPARSLLAKLYSTAGISIVANVEDAPPPPSDVLLSVPYEVLFPAIIRKRYDEKDIVGTLRSCDIYSRYAGPNAGNLFCMVALQQELGLFLTDGSLATEEHLRQATEQFTYMELLIPIQSLQLMDLPRTLVISSGWGNYCSSAWAEQIAGKKLAVIPKATPTNKIRIGYIGSEFRIDGPVSDHLRGVILYHNTDQFEVYLYPILSLDVKQDDQLKFEQAAVFYRRMCYKEGKCTIRKIYEMSLFEAEEQIRRDRIDILINISGFGKKDTVTISVSKPAPIQINFLGWPATLGVKWYDYMISHEVATPRSFLQHYSEKMIYLPAGPFPSSHKLLYPHLLDRTPENGSSYPNKTALGLPEDKFIFANFNRFFKIDRSLFARWMNILKRVPDSVIWLIEWDPLGADNIRVSAEQYGVSASRIVFTPHVSSTADHIVTLHNADLILDSWIYSGGITTLNCLWAGVPVLSLVGKTFAQRMSAASISSFDSQLALDHLLALSPQEYEEKAVEMATNESKMKTIRKRVEETRRWSKQFNIEEWVRSYETGLSMAWKRHFQLSLPPDHLVVLSSSLSSPPS